MFRAFRRQQRQMANPALVQALQQAQALIAQGQPARAADLLAGQAGQVGSAGHPRQAANLHARAAHVYVDAGNENAALVQARLALNGFLAAGMNVRSAQFYPRIQQHLANQKMTGAAAALQQEYGTRLAALPTPQAAPSASAPAAPRRRGRLPTACPQCSAPVRPDEIEWLDEQTSECPYCGAILQAIE